MRDRNTRQASAIAAHIEEHIGSIETAFPQQDAAGCAVLVHHVLPTIERPVHTLVTSGMSELALPAPDRDEATRLELMMTLPRDWKFDPQSLRDEQWRWPVNQLQYLAGIPADRGSGLAWGDTILNGDPPRPFASNTRLCAVIIAPSLLVPPEFYQLRDDDQTITFYSAIPLYREEVALKHEQGMETILTRLLDHGINDLIDPRRRNVARKKFLGLF
jgi:hypothetical protein